MITNPHHDTVQLRGPTQLAQLVVRQFLCPGDCAVDATCGNGHDTLLLADVVGPTGKVWAFDIQEEAIRQTGQKLEKSGQTERVKLLLAGHETLSEHVSIPVKAVIFNLGYLPGGDRGIITKPETTITALQQALQLLLPTGVVAITVYPGHPGGDNEETAVSRWSGSLDQRLFHAWRMGQVNAMPGAPYFFLIQKAA
ncbi:MAG: class I SAM-dependent methyltransferase [Desulfuromonadales bacterium]|nr:class I SAM-dependent methyltransferase [Desulfuromonadales bacterium]